MMEEAYDDLEHHMIYGAGQPPVLNVVADGAALDEERIGRILRAVAARRRRLEAVEAAARVELARVNEWLDGERRRLSTELLEQTLRQYHEARLAEGGPTTIHLPAGELRSRASTKWEFDADLFVPWAIEHAPEAVRVKHEPDKAAAKALVKNGVLVRECEASGPLVHLATGELVPGVTVSAERSFTVVTTVEGW